MDLPHEKWFYFPDGSGAKNLNELKGKLEIISYSDFYHHVADGRNDFANWIRYVLGDPQLADDLEKVDSIVESVEILNDYLHPGVAKKHLDAQDDIQSQIEKEVGITDIPEGHEESTTTEEPTHENSETDLEKSWDMPGPEHEEPVVEPTEEPVPAVEPLDASEQAPASALDSAQQPVDEQDEEEDVTAAAISTHYRKQAAEKKEIEHFHHDIGTLIVKDFIIGLIFGLVVGFLLARMITIF